MTKSFDCVEMKRAGARRIHELLSTMNRDEQVEYWRQRSEEFRRRVEEARGQISPGERPAR